MEEAQAPRLVMIAGPNGSGKSTLIAALYADPGIHLPARYINADDLQRERGIVDAHEAQQLATNLRIRALEARQDLMYETVMSHPSKIAELQQARTAGYHLTVHLVATEDPAINIERVAARVGAGGHDVPADRIRARYERMLALAPVAIAYADQAVVFDNTQGGDTGQGLAVHAVLHANRLALTVNQPANWVQTMAAQVNERLSELRAFAGAAESRGLSFQLARLDGGSTQGPIMAIGKHYLLQYDDMGKSSILHDRALLGALAEPLSVQDTRRFRYRKGVASIELPPTARTQ